MAPPVIQHLRVDAFGGAAQSQLAQGNQIASAEKTILGAFRLLGHIDLALVHPRQ